MVEAYLDCFATKDLSRTSFPEDVTFEGPRMPKLVGRATVLGFLGQILPMLRGIQWKQHIVEGQSGGRLTPEILFSGKLLKSRLHRPMGPTRLLMMLHLVIGLALIHVNLCASASNQDAELWQTLID